MYLKICFLITFYINCQLSHSLISRISEDTRFIHRTFSLPPAWRVTIEYDVTIPGRLKWEYMRMGIYTTQDHLNIKKRCTQILYGQFCNYKLHPRLYEPVPLACRNGTLTGVTHYTGSTTVQDFTPRNLSFSFGFECDKISPNSSLRGIVYNVSIYDHRRAMKCIHLNETRAEMFEPILPYCFNNIRLPNLMGISDIQKLFLDWEFFEMHFIISYATGLCHKHLGQFFCGIYYPDCYNSIPPCRETCLEIKEACSGPLLGFLSEDCDYLPSSGDNIRCSYEPVTCSSAPFMKNAWVKPTRESLVFETAEYWCDSGYQLEGNKTITCHYSGLWSTPPQCVKSVIKSRTSEYKLALLVIVPSLFCLLIILIIIIGCKYRNKSKKDCLEEDKAEQDTIIGEPQQTDTLLLQPSVAHTQRKGEYDAFVLYQFDTDDDFVINHLLPQLEERRKFKLCIHSRNFTPGRDIKDNIEEAIEASNSAIIVMSQGFVDSIWCKEEFKHCYIENMKDPAFNLFVIMMQRADTLVKISPYMKTCFANKNYLQVDDPELFTKLTTRLRQTRGIDDLNQNNGDNDIDNQIESDED